MSAQKAQEQSMEDILASIRKIISEDSKEEPASVPHSDDPAVDGSPQVNTFTPASQTPASAPLPSSLPIAASTAAAGPISNSPEPSVLVERREILAESFVSDTDSTSKPTPVAPVETAPETITPETATPEIKPVKTVAPETVDPKTVDPETVTTNERVEAKPPETGNPSSGLTQSAPDKEPDGNAADPGPAERKPSTTGENISQDANSEKSAETETPLHPAIANAKAFVGAQEFAKTDSAKSNSPALNSMEKPVFAETTDSSNRSSLALSMEPLISPDSVERREYEERRNHPLRRGADREVEEFKGALMSPQTNDAVLNAFEQLKNSATDNIDGKVEALLRPMLREWLDNNLPLMVERLVRDEIERVSRGE